MKNCDFPQGNGLALIPQAHLARCPSASTSWTGWPTQLLDALRRCGLKRLVVDGISGFQQAAVESEWIVRFWSALSNELRAIGVTGCAGC